MAYSHRTFSPTIYWSVCVCLSSAFNCGKMVARIWMWFGMVGQTNQGMRQAVGFGDRCTGGGNYGGKCGLYHCNQWGVCSIAV